LLIVATDPEDTPQTIEEFRDRGDIVPLPWTVDRSGEVSRSSGANALETTVIVDREGDTVYRDATSTDRETLERELEEVF
jgi:hypothetical protein